ncbi:MAG TPA: hypothetical protein DEP35_02200 [Deltaproteobacteria bacterium]|nr:hypothetical protein [Deltaproteobacteria bacterium]
MYQRAPFIWSELQPVQPGGLFSVFLGGAQRRDDGQNRFFLFRRRFEIPSPPAAATLAIFVDGRYQLFVNGVRVGRGPARSDPHHPRVDSYEVSPFLRGGENVIGVLVHVHGIDTSWYETVKGGWQPVFGDGALWSALHFHGERAPADVSSDADWRSLECAAWERNVPRVNFGLGFVEVHDARAMPPGWAAPGFDDGAWDGVHILSVGGGPPDAPFGGQRVRPFPTLLHREIPHLLETPLAPRRVAHAFAVAPRPDLPVHRRLYEEPRLDLPAGSIQDRDALLTPDERATIVQTRPGSDVALLLDFGRIHSGHPFVELEARGGEVLELAAAECAVGEWTGAADHDLSLDPTRGHGSHLFRYVARPGLQRFERFEWTAVRWVQLTVRDAPEGLAIRHVGSLHTRYPAQARGRFECSDPLLETLWEAGRYTLQQCMHDGWEDCPSREQRQWLGDATVEFLVAQAAFGPSANALNRQFLLHAAESQRPDGLTQMYAPGDHRTNAILIPDWTLQWILNAEQHWLYSGDLETIEEVFPAIERALAWFEPHRGPSALLADVPHWNFIDWAAVGRGGEAATTNALLVGALRAAARLARALESARAARRYDARADAMAAALNTRHWDARRGVYVDEVDPASGARDPRVSQHANAALVLFGVAPSERWGSMLNYVMEPRRGVFTAAPPIVPTGGSLDPETQVVLANTFFSHFVYRALCRAGRFERALLEMRARYGSMLERGATTLWESFDPTGSLCHGFSATPVYQLSTEILGVLPLAPGFRRFRVSPKPVDLSFARGTFPTVRGDIEVAWERGPGGLELELEVPSGAQAELIAPEGLCLRGAPRVGPGRHEVRFDRSPGG